jgi:hypothetical protein
MPERSCRVTIKDMEGVEHTVEVRAETLYEAVAKGLVALRGDRWVSEIPEGLNEVKVASSPIEHCVQIQKFKAWLKQQGRGPADMIARKRVRNILGVPENPR